MHLSRWHAGNEISTREKRRTSHDGTAGRVLEEAIERAEKRLVELKGLSKPLSRSEPLADHGELDRPVQALPWSSRCLQRSRRALWVVCSSQYVTFRYSSVGDAAILPRAFFVNAGQLTLVCCTE